MNAAAGQSRPSWRVSESRVLRPELWLVAAVAVTMMLVEVWQSSRVAELSLRLGQSRSALVQVQTKLQFERAELEHRSTRSELAPLAQQLGLAPADARQIVNLPAEYLADAGDSDRGADAASLVTLAERLSRALVPDATARARARN
jgi:hypothetical protein